MIHYVSVDLHAFFEKVVKLGGYDGCVHGKAWKSIYDELGGNPQNTSAATCTRRHYERYFLTLHNITKDLYYCKFYQKSNEFAHNIQIS